MSQLAMMKLHANRKPKRLKSSLLEESGVSGGSVLEVLASTDR